MNEPIRRLLVCCVLAMGAVPPVEALSLAEQLELCAAEADDARRLDCYDRIARKPAPASAPAAPTHPGPASAPPTAPTASAPAPSPAAADVANTAEATSSPAEFGASNGPMAAKRQAKSVKSISATVANVVTRPRGELVVTLDNGQVWLQLTAVDYFPLKVGDSVEISSGALGSYILSAPSRRSTKVTRIH